MVFPSWHVGSQRGSFSKGDLALRTPSLYQALVCASARGWKLAVQEMQRAGWPSRGAVRPSGPQKGLRYHPC